MCYWAWRQSNWQCLPEPGGVLDQDVQLMTDMNVYGRWYSIAENRAKQGSKLLDIVKKRLGWQ